MQALKDRGPSQAQEPQRMAAEDRLRHVHEIHPHIPSRRTQDHHQKLLRLSDPARQQRPQEDGGQQRGLQQAQIPCRNHSQTCPGWRQAILRENAKIVYAGQETPRRPSGKRQSHPEQP